MTTRIARRLAPVSVAMLFCCLLPGAARAAAEEIQVYMDDMRDPGQLGVDVHNNYVFSGRRTPEYAGEQPPGKVYRMTPEFAYGLTREVELGLYVLTTRDADGNWHGDGGKVRIKYIAPHDAEAGFFWGANLEVGRTTRRVSETPWNAEVKGIAGYRTGPWTFAVNPNFDWSISRGGGPATADLDLKVSYDLGSKTEVGVESYNELGAIKHPSFSGENARTIFAVIDKDFGKFDINAGIGRGLTGAADRWLLKFIVGTNF
jgi:hypothetical protein